MVMAKQEGNTGPFLIDLHLVYKAEMCLYANTC